MGSRSKLDAIRDELDKSESGGGEVTQILEHLKGLQVRHELRAQRQSNTALLHAIPTLNPDSRLKKLWDALFAVLLLFVCFKEPLHIGFQSLFASPFWDRLEIASDVVFSLATRKS